MKFVKGLLNVVFVVLLILKLTHQIDISWWLVTAPLWGPIAFLMASPLIIFAFVIALPSIILAFLMASPSIILAFLMASPLIILAFLLLGILFLLVKYVNSFSN